MKTRTPGLLDGLSVSLGASLQAEISRAIATALRAVADQLDGTAAPKRRGGRPPRVISLAPEPAAAPARRGGRKPRSLAAVPGDGAPAPKLTGRLPRDPAAREAKLRAIAAARAAREEGRRKAAEEGAGA